MANKFSQIPAYAKWINPDGTPTRVLIDYFDKLWSRVGGVDTFANDDLAALVVDPTPSAEHERDQRRIEVLMLSMELSASRALIQRMERRIDAIEAETAGNSTRPTIKKLEERIDALEVEMHGHLV